MCTLEALKGHLWHISEPLAGLAFFDVRIKNDKNTKMVEALQHNNRVGIKEELFISTNLEHLTISNLISSKIKELFTKLKIHNSFLCDPLIEWLKN